LQEETLYEVEFVTLGGKTLSVARFPQTRRDRSLGARFRTRARVPDGASPRST
jgi:hypothetical protein